MFGTVVCNVNELTEEEISRYQSTYCGLCFALKKHYGQLCRLTLNYDMSFMAMLLSSLYEGENKVLSERCLAHGLRKQEVFSNKYIDYAADMTILLAYYKCMDDWSDENKLTSKIYAGYLKKDIAEIEHKYPRQALCVKESIVKICELEKSDDIVRDEIVNCSGRMLSELFVYYNDYWQNSLRQLGYELGRFIYLMDVVLDYETDIRKHTYNPLLQLGITPFQAEPLLIQAIGNAVEEFEKLPLVQDVGILRNVLYSGVWQQFNKKLKERKTNNGK